MKDVEVSHFISFTPELLRRFKRAYEKARARGKDHFAFEGKGFLVSYARYVIQYTESEFKRRGIK